MRTILLLLTLAGLGFAPLPFKKPKDTRSVAEKCRAGDLLLEYRSFEGVPWPAVFKWLGEQTGIPVLYTPRPTGTFTFVHPGRDRLLTIREFHAALSREMAKQGYRLILKERNWLVIPDDE